MKIIVATLLALFAGTRADSLQPLRKTIKDDDMLIEYWPEYDEDSKQQKLVCKMIWTNFVAPEPYKNETEWNRNSENDNIRVCFNIKPNTSKFYDQCNFFIRQWVNPKTPNPEIKLWDGVKSWIQSPADV